MTQQLGRLATHWERTVSCDRRSWQLRSVAGHFHVRIDFSILLNDSKVQDMFMFRTFGGRDRGRDWYRQSSHLFRASLSIGPV